MSRRKKFTQADALRAAEQIVQDMANGTFVTDTDPINVAREVDLLIKNFGIEKAADVAAAMANYDQNEPDRVSDWNDVERVIRARRDEIRKH
jgi:hypothetical protein